MGWPKSSFRFFQRCYGKTQAYFLANPFFMVWEKGSTSFFCMWISSCLIIAFLWKLLTCLSSNLFDSFRNIEAFLWLFWSWKKKALEKISLTITIRATKIFCLEKWKCFRCSGGRKSGKKKRWWRKDGKESNWWKCLFFYGKMTAVYILLNL